MSYTSHKSDSGPSAVVAGLLVQRRVIGAIMLRELHTRFGRNNVGYIWLVIEPMILSVGVSIFHVLAHVSLPFGFTPGSFYAAGYITFIVFRNNVNRSTALLDSNRPLLFHKMVTVFDISIGRSVLEVISSLGAMIIMLVAFFLLGLSPLPSRPWFICAGLGLMGAFSAGVAMCITAFCSLYPLLERFVHPATYLMLPFTGMFFVLGELPPRYASALSWALLPQLTDIARMGLVDTYNSQYINPGYIVTVTSVVWLIGLLALRLARSRMHFE